MSEFITIQVGQCGNQIGSEFWPLVLKEYGLTESSKTRWTGSVNSFLSPSNDCSSTPLDFLNGNLKARALIIDMEDSVVSRFERGSLQKLFDKKDILRNSGGSGNNWGVGFYEHGNEQCSVLEEMIRVSVEKCDYLHGFLTMFSLAGGTGSGLGTRILSLLPDFYPRTERFAVCVHPGSQIDVINAPYNISFALSRLLEFASCVFPVDNEALSDICQNHRILLHNNKPCTYNNMNRIICKMLLELTSGARFPGSVNLDLSDLATNMVPFPSLNFISTSLSPIVPSSPKPSPKNGRTVHSVNNRTADIFPGILSKHNELMKISALRGTVLSACLHGRGNLTVTTMKQYCQRLSKHCKLAAWDPYIKFGMCSIAPADSAHSLLCLTNSCAMSSVFVKSLCSFDQLYKKKAYVHHYENLACFPEDEFDCARESLLNVIQSYDNRSSAVR